MPTPITHLCFALQIAGEICSMQWMSFSEPTHFDPDSLETMVQNCILEWSLLSNCPPLQSMGWVSEWASRVLRPHQHVYRSLWRRVFPVNHLHWYWQPNKNNQETEHTNNTMQKVALVNSTTHSKKSSLTEKTDRAWFSCLVRHPASNGNCLFLQPRSPHRAAVNRYQLSTSVVNGHLYTALWDLIRSGQSTASSQIVKCCWSCKHA